MPDSFTTELFLLKDLCDYMNKKWESEQHSF